MKLSFLSAVLALFALGPVSARADILSFSGKPQLNIEQVPVYGQASVREIGGKNVDLKLTGAGVRIKKVVFVNIKAYVLASYLQDSTGLAANPMAVIDRNPVKALRLTFLRDISGSRMQDAFKDSLAENGYKPDDSTYGPILKQIAEDVKEKSTLDIVELPFKGDEDVLVFQYPDRKVTTKGKGIASAFWKIWFGKPADGELQDLKNEIVGAK